MHGNPYWVTIVGALRTIVESGSLGWALLVIALVGLGSSLSYHDTGRIQRAEQNRALEYLRR